MDSIDSGLASAIRQDIIEGTLEHGTRITEARLCDWHNVSRTPVRLALRRLEQEGMIRKSEGRGYVVQEITVDDIRHAVQVRGHLESLGARLMAQSPNRMERLPEMTEAIRTIENLTNQGRLDEAAIHQMQAANETFHTTILEACGNDYVKFTCDQISHLPMLAAGSMVFDRAVHDTPDQIERGLFRLRIGNAQHKVICEAIETGDAVRAEGMMREHSHTMIEYIETFEKQDKALTVSDLVAYSAADPTQTQD